MTTNLPTKPGPYWWRAKEGDELRIIHVEVAMLNDEPEVNGMCCESPESGEYVHVSEMGGQWSRIPTPDEGLDAFEVIGPKGEMICVWDDEQHTKDFIKTFNKVGKVKYTCRKVRVIPVEEGEK